MYIKENLKQRFRLEWLGNIQNDTRPKPQQRNKLRTYRLFKQIFERESYLINVKTNDIRSMVTKLRISSHKLQIEAGRHPWVEEKLRLCNVCNTNNIENEVHFMMQCIAYQDIRNKFLRKIIWRLVHGRTLNMREQINVPSHKSTWCVGDRCSYQYILIAPVTTWHWMK